MGTPCRYPSTGMASPAGTSPAVAPCSSRARQIRRFFSVVRYRPARASGTAPALAGHGGRPALPGAQLRLRQRCNRRRQSQRRPAARRPGRSRRSPAHSLCRAVARGCARSPGRRPGGPRRRCDRSNCRQRQGCGRWRPVAVADSTGWRASLPLRCGQGSGWRCSDAGRARVLRCVQDATPAAPERTGPSLAPI